MATNSNKNNQNTQPRILNKRATYDYAIEERYEAGLVLHGWEVKAFAQAAPKLTLPTSTFVTASCFSAMHI